MRYGEDSDRMYRVNVRDDITVRVLVLEKEGTQVRLTTAHHLLDCRDDGGIPNDDGLIEPREQRATSDRQGKNLGV